MWLFSFSLNVLKHYLFGILRERISLLCSSNIFYAGLVYTLQTNENARTNKVETNVNNRIFFINIYKTNSTQRPVSSKNIYITRNRNVFLISFSPNTNSTPNQFRLLYTKTLQAESSLKPQIKAILFEKKSFNTQVARLPPRPLPRGHALPKAAEREREGEEERVFKLTNFQITKSIVLSCLFRLSCMVAFLWAHITQSHGTRVL